MEKFVQKNESAWKQNCIVEKSVCLSEHLKILPFSWACYYLSNILGQLFFRNLKTPDINLLNIFEHRLENYIFLIIISYFFFSIYKEYYIVLISRKNSCLNWYSRDIKAAQKLFLFWLLNFRILRYQSESALCYSCQMGKYRLDSEDMVWVDPERPCWIGEMMEPSSRHWVSDCQERSSQVEYEWAKCNEGKDHPYPLY